jgi:hydrogenase expression/formation protein HypD
MTPQTIKIMEVCGTHTMAIARAGIKELLPKTIELVSGPGCPVCVTAQVDIDRAIAIAQKKDVILATFGDMMRVPGSEGSLEKAKRTGADVRMVYSCLDALTVARQNPKKRVIFLGVGFETTSPTVAATILQAKQDKVANFYVLSNFKLIFPALKAIAANPCMRIKGFLCPGHVSVITGTGTYQDIARRYKIPCVITGFEAADIMKGIERLLHQIRSNEHKVEIEYTRAVSTSGNTKARAVLNRVFYAADSQWRGLGLIPQSGLAFRKEFRALDADKAFSIKIKKIKPEGPCLCAKVLQGLKIPTDCRLFVKSCTPLHPIGPCMVSSEGACAAYFKYQRKAN